MGRRSVERVERILIESDLSPRPHEARAMAIAAVEALEAVRGADSATPSSGRWNNNPNDFWGFTPDSEYQHGGPNAHAARQYERNKRRRKSND